MVVTRNTTFKNEKREVWRESFLCGSKFKSPRLLHQWHWRARLTEGSLSCNKEVLFALLLLAKFLQKKKKKRYLFPSSDRFLSGYSLVFLPLFIKSFDLC